MPFICFEGIDGSGKTTLSSLVSKALVQAGFEVINLREGKELLSPVANTIRNLAKDPANLSMTPWTEFLLYLAREKQVFDEKVQTKTMHPNTFIIADRSMYSPLVMAQDIRGINSPIVEDMVKELFEGNEPETVFFCDVDLDVSQTRKKIAKQLEPSSKVNSRKGLWGLSFRKLMRQGYVRLSKNNPKWCRIDNNSHNTDFALHSILLRLQEQYQIKIPHPVLENPLALTHSLKTSKSFRDFSELYALFLESYHASHPMLKGFLLTGLHGEKWAPLRLALFEENFLAGLLSFKGSDSKEQKLPYILKALNSNNKNWQLAGIKALSGGLTITWEKEIIEEYTSLNPDEFLQLIKGVDEAWAFTIRNQFWETHPNSVLESLSKIDTAEAWAIRQKAFQMGSSTSNTTSKFVKSKLRDSFLLGLAYVNSPKAWEIREALYEEHIWSTLLSLKGVSNDSHPLAKQWRNQNLELAPKLVLKTLKFLDDEDSWIQRKQCSKAWVELLDSLKGFTHPRAQEIRQEFWSIAPHLVYNSLGLSFFEISLDQNPWYQKALSENSTSLLLIKSILTQEDKRKRWTLL